VCPSGRNVLHHRLLETRGNRGRLRLLCACRSRSSRTLNSFAFTMIPFGYRAWGSARASRCRNHAFPFRRGTASMYGIPDCVSLAYFSGHHEILRFSRPSSSNSTGHRLNGYQSITCQHLHPAEILHDRRRVVGVWLRAQFFSDHLRSTHSSQPFDSCRARQPLL